MTSYLPLITGGGGALVVLVLWLVSIISGEIHTDREFSRLNEENISLREENAYLRSALDAERRSASDVARAGAVTNQLISALRDMAAERKQAGSPVIGVKELGL